MFDRQESPQATTFNLLVDSDWHANYDSANVQGAFRQAYTNLIDDKICLGDVLLYRATETTETDYDYWSDTLLVLGNHDMLAASSGWDWSIQPSNTQAYNRWYRPYIATTGIDIPENELFWTKTYADKGILLVGGYCMFNTTEKREAQKQFFIQAFETALQQNFKVIIAYHWGFEDMTVIPCSFTDTDVDMISAHDSTFPETYPYEEELTELVNQYKARGMQFICWLNGHRHLDEILIKDGQLHVLVGSTKFDSGNDLKRSTESVTQALCNLVTVIDDRIVIRRYGADIKSYGGLRHLLIVTTDGEIVFDWGV